jgi:predicted signal transduction protein with EAL and GGDEF domain
LLTARQAIVLSVTIGIAIGQYSTADKLLRDADLALYSAKAAGKSRYVIFEPPVEPGSTPPLGQIPPHLGPTPTAAGG